LASIGAAPGNRLGPARTRLLAVCKKLHNAGNDARYTREVHLTLWGTWENGANEPSALTATTSYQPWWG
jgi:hypothetical protein